MSANLVRYGDRNATRRHLGVGRGGPGCCSPLCGESVPMFGYWFYSRASWVAELPLCGACLRKLRHLNDCVGGELEQERRGEAAA